MSFSCLDDAVDYQGIKIGNVKSDKGKDDRFLFCE